MSSSNSIRRQLFSFTRTEDGAALVEFGFLLPTMLLILAIMVEGGRMIWSYQTTIAGVRDATRFLSKSAPTDICASGGTLDGMTAKLAQIVGESVDGSEIFPTTVTVTSVTPTLICVAGGLRQDPAPVATVTANVTFAFPFSGYFTFLGLSIEGVSTSVIDQTRILG